MSEKIFQSPTIKPNEQTKSPSASAIGLKDNRPDTAVKRELLPKFDNRSEGDALPFNKANANSPKQNAAHFIDNRQVSQTQRVLQKAANNYSDNQYSNNNPYSVRNSTQSGANPIQRRITQGGTQYSFLSAHDLNGNPYLSSEGVDGRNTWSINEEQTSIALTQQNSLYSAIDQPDKQVSMNHNLSMGREQRVSYRGQKAILHPFKSYQFGPNTPPDVSVYNVDENEVAEKAKLYSDYYDRLRFIIYNAEQSNANDIPPEVSQCKSEMGPLILAEDYRTEGALEIFEARWMALVDAFNEYFASLKEKQATEEATGEDSASSNEPATKRRRLRSDGPPGRHEIACTNLDLAARLVTRDLPWAKQGGKNKFRAAHAGNRTWQTTERPIDRSGMSPEQSSTSGRWVPNLSLDSES